MIESYLFFYFQNDSGLCVPRKIVSKAAIFTADLDSIGTVGKFKDIIDKLADVITYWNGNIDYSDRPKKGESKGNCQDFCQAVLTALGIDPQFCGPMEIYLKVTSIESNQFSLKKNPFRK